MNRSTARALGIAALLALAPAIARAQMPSSTSYSVVSSQPSTDAGASTVSMSGLRSWFIDLLQSRAWLGAGSSPVIARTPKAVRVRRAGATRTQTWVP